MVYSELELEDLWSQWILNNRHKVKVIVHSKYALKVKSEELRNVITQIETIETKWGDFSLVEATLLLFKKAIEDPYVEYCAILSGMCIPIKPFEYVYTQIMNGNGKTFLHKFGKQKKINIPVSKQYICKHEQWIVVNRAHVEYFLREMFRIKFIFKRPNIISDETWCATFLNLNGKGNEFIDKQTTFTNWKEIEDNCHPKTYNTITDIELDRILDCDSFFARKFNKTSFNKNQISRIVYRIQNSSTASPEEECYSQQDPQSGQTVSDQ